jgi:methionyl-tRNA synthetase
MMLSPKKIYDYSGIVACTNGPIHIGHLCLRAFGHILSGYLRLQGRDVLFVWKRRTRRGDL